MTGKPARPERWAARGDDAAVLKLEIPPDLVRERTFEISCAMTVRPVAGAESPWHELRVSADGEIQWSRRIATARGEPYDGLDVRFRRTLAPGQRLVLLAQVNGAGVRRRSLELEADECGDGG